MKRIVPGLLIAGLWLLLLLKGGIQIFCLLIVPVVFIATDEYLRMADRRQVSFFERCLLNLLISFPVLLVCFQPTPQSLVPAVLVSFFGLTGYLCYRYRDIADGYSFYCRLIFGLFYVGMLAAHVVLLRFLDSGAEWLVVASAITACSDSGAYFVGRAIGKRKLCSNISPNKTIAGAVGGLVCGVLAALAAATLLLKGVPYFQLAFVAALLCVAGIFGDLAESIIKRGTGTKDSGSCLAGHGGILDRVDSLLFVCPILYYFLPL